MIVISPFYATLHRLELYCLARYTYHCENSWVSYSLSSGTDGLNEGLDNFDVNTIRMYLVTCSFGLVGWLGYGPSARNLRSSGSIGGEAGTKAVETKPIICAGQISGPSIAYVQEASLSLFYSRPVSHPGPLLSVLHFPVFCIRLITALTSQTDKRQLVRSCTLQETHLRLSLAWSVLCLSVSSSCC